MRNVVLVACADSNRREHLAEVLQAAGYHPLLASTGSEALATATSYLPQLAVVHAELPEVEGTDVCLRLKQDLGNDRIAVLLIGRDKKEERFVGSEVGADAYLVEPYADPELVSEVKSLFSRLLLNAR